MNCKTVSSSNLPGRAAKDVNLPGQCYKAFVNEFCKRVTLTLAAILIALPLTAATPTLGKDALRKLVRLPSITFQPSWTYDPESGFVMGSAIEDFTREITSVRDSLKDNPNDAGKFLRLAELYAATHDDENARKSSLRAVELYRDLAQSQSDDADVLTSFGSALRLSDKMSEAESVLRKAVQLAPKNWHCRVALGRLLDAEARRAIYDRPPLAPERPTSVEVALAQQRLSEAGDNFELAVTSATNEPEAYFRRGMHRCLRATLSRQIRVAQGEEISDVDLADSAFSPDTLADLQRASQLSPRDYSRIGGTAIFGIFTACEHRGVVDWSEVSWNSLPDKTQRSLHDAITRLENLGQDSDPHVASGALEVLGILQGPMLRETQSCISTLRRAVTLDASREQALEVLVSTLAHAARYDELLSVCEDRVKQKDSERSHMLLAKAYEKLQQWDDAESELLEVLRQSPNNFPASLGVAAAILRRSNADGDGLPEANSWLSRAEALLGQMPALERNQQLVIDLTLIRSIYFALTDDLDSARQWAQAVLKTDGNNKLAREILSAMDY
jgi:tetratricopeptide (TPR) repeat protein